MRLVGRMVLDRNPSTTSSPRPSRSRSAPRTSCPASTSPTTRCCRAATSRTSTRSSSGSASPNFTHIPINAPKCPFANFQQDGHMAMINPVGRANYEPNSWTGEQGGPREDPTVGSPASRPRDRREAAPAARELRRPLQPGPPVLPQPDADRAAAHRRRARVRAEQGRDAGDPRADGGQPAQRRRTARRRHRRRARGRTAQGNSSRRRIPTCR